MIGAHKFFPLCFYYRVANQYVDQAKVYRDEKNIVHLYLIIYRYTSLLSEIIPQHPSYSTYTAEERLHHEKILKVFIKEMEILKPLLGRKNDEINRQLKERPLDGVNDSSLTPQKRSEKEHASSSSERKVQYCAAVENKSHRQNFSANYMSVVCGGSAQSYITSDNIGTASAAVENATTCAPSESRCSTSSTMARDWDINVHIVTQSTPSPVISCIENIPHPTHVSHITVADSKNRQPETSCDGSSASKVIHDIHISQRLMEDFLELARDNTDKNLETCGVLGAFLKNGTFYVTTLIIPKQESTSDSCQTLNEEEFYFIQEEHSLFPVGWIHTHPSQACFMSSVDLHTHYSYQVMLPEAVAIVMAPTDTSRSYGIFRLSDPGGISILKDCPERGFHSHQEPADGAPIYEDCSNVYMNSNLRFEIIDLR